MFTRPEVINAERRAQLDEPNDRGREGQADQGLLGSPFALPGTPARLERLLWSSLGSNER